MAPIYQQNTYKALELLEDYYKQLQSTDDVELKQAIETVIRTFKSQLFKTLMEIQEYYENTLMNKNMSLAEKKMESLKLLDKHSDDGLDSKEMENDEFNNENHNGSDYNKFREGYDAEVDDSAPTLEDVMCGNKIVDIHQWKTLFVKLQRGESGFGFTISGGVDCRHIPEDSGIFVASVIEGGVAMIDGNIRENDVIVNVNGEQLIDVSHSDAVHVLMNAGNEINIHLRRRLDSQRILEFDLYKGKMSLGLSVAGGVGNEYYSKDCLIYVIKIIPGGVAQLDGRISVGDCIMSVNGSSLENVSHKEAINILRCNNDPVHLVVKKMSDTGYIDADKFDIVEDENCYEQDEVFVEEEGNVGYHSTQVSNELNANSSRHSFNVQNEPISSLKFQSLRAVNDENVLYSTSSERSQNYNTSQPPVVDVNHSNSLNHSHASRSASNITNAEVDQVTRGQRQVTLHRNENERSLGFNIVGGDEKFGVFISFISVGGVAARSGELYKGDCILSVNGVDLTEASHSDAVSVLKNASGLDIDFVVQYAPEGY